MFSSIHGASQSIQSKVLLSLNLIDGYFSEPRLFFFWRRFFEATAKIIAARDHGTYFSRRGDVGIQLVLSHPFRGSCLNHLCE